MENSTPVAILRNDYQPSDWSISHTRLHVVLHPEQTRVHCELALQRVSVNTHPKGTLELDGVDLVLESVAVDGQCLSSDSYEISEDKLLIRSLNDQVTLSLTTCINPQANTALEGLYLSSGNFCTQCEAEGFRKITYYLDRPDVLSVFDVTIDAEQAQYPVLLSNGNLVSQQTLPDGWHRVSWHDPHPKPSYLFALVGGDLAVVEDRFKTGSGRSVLLQIYVQSHNRHRCEFALASLKAAMAWEEQVYGLEYDLDRYMIVAVDDFNMGAMENKGLNIFNSRYVLADLQTATDTDFVGVEAVIAHEYFHNWTGNRITCRDWFQLSLKEGLTVFRDQCFTSDRHSATVKRIEDVRLLRDRQFAEDAGPMAHPIRPDSYIEINNFYTLTVYEKGAEVIRMLHTLLGERLWQQGMQVYVRDNDGKATTCDAFIDAMQSVSDHDLTQFRRWYSTAGTPVLTVDEHYDTQAGRYTLTLTQQTPNTPGQSEKQPLHMPLVMGLMHRDGSALQVDQHRTHEGIPEDSFIIDVTQRTQSIVFDDVHEKPVASLLRGFSAPVKLVHAVDNETLAFLVANDTDSFNRWDACQRLAERLILSSWQADSLNDEKALNLLLGGIDATLNDDALEPAFKAEVLQPPSIATLAEAIDQLDYQHLSHLCEQLRRAIADRFQVSLTALVADNIARENSVVEPQAIGSRKLANTALALLSYLPASQWETLASEQYESADCLTNRLSALACLCHSDSTSREQALAHFYNLANKDKLMTDKWFAVQAASRRKSALHDVQSLCVHPDYDQANPNRVRTLMLTFSNNNPRSFHRTDGQGYDLLSAQVMSLDTVNPQLAARLVQPLTQWKKLYPPSQDAMRRALQRIADTPRLSRDLYELVSKSL